MKYVIDWPPTDTYRNTGKRNYHSMMNMRPFQLDIHGKRNYPLSAHDAKPESKTKVDFLYNPLSPHLHPQINHLTYVPHHVPHAIRRRHPPLPAPH